MKTMINATIGAAVGGLLGAAAWAALMYFLHLEIGWLAWGVGILAGVGVAVVVKDERTAMTGVIAAVIALGSLALGKYAGVHFLAKDALSEMQADLLSDNFTFTLADAQISLADQVVEEYEDQGKAVNWPAGMTYEDAEQPEHYPPDLWADAQGRWNAMSAAEQEDYRAQQQASIQSAIASMGGEIRSMMEAEGFKSSFSMWDFIFGGLALVTAFKIGSGGDESSQAA